MEKVHISVIFLLITVFGKFVKNFSTDLKSAGSSAFLISLLKKKIFFGPY